MAQKTQLTSFHWPYKPSLPHKVKKNNFLKFKLRKNATFPKTASVRFSKDLVVYKTHG